MFIILLSSFVSLKIIMFGKKFTWKWNRQFYKATGCGDVQSTRLEPRVALPGAAKWRKLSRKLAKKYWNFAWGFGGKIRFPTRFYLRNENYSNLHVPLVFWKMKKLFGFARVFLVEKWKGDIIKSTAFWLLASHAKIPFHAAVLMMQIFWWTST